MPSDGQPSAYESLHAIARKADASTPNHHAQKSNWTPSVLSMLPSVGAVKAVAWSFTKPARWLWTQGELTNSSSARTYEANSHCQARPVAAAATRTNGRSL